MINLYKATHKPVYVVAVSVVRYGYRLAAKKARKKGDYVRAKEMNKKAYEGDVLLRRCIEW